MVRGPHVEQVILPLIDTMNGQLTWRQLADLLPGISTSAIENSAAELQRLGVLAQAKPPAFGLTLESQHFLERYYGARCSSQRSPLSPINFQLMEIRIFCKAPWANLFLKSLQGLGVKSVAQVDNLVLDFIRPISSVMVKEASSLIEFCACTKHRHQYYIIVTKIAEAAKFDSMVSIEISEASIVAAIAHWVFAASLGFPVTNSLSKNEILNRPARHFNDNSFVPTAPNVNDLTDKNFVQMCEMVAAFCVGSVNVKGAIRQLAPTAGGVAAVHAIWLVADGAKKIVRGLYYEAARGKLIEFATLPLAMSQSFVQAGQSGILILIASYAELSEHYGDAAYRLSCYDIGFAFDYAVRAARLFGIAENQCHPALEASSLVRNLPIDGSWLISGTSLRTTENGIRAQKDAQISAALNAAEYEFLLTRRSVREFSDKLPSILLLQQLEQKLLHAFQEDLRHRENDVNISIVRILAKDADNVLVHRFELLLRGKQPPSTITEIPRGRLNWIIRQSDLADAPLVYLFEDTLRNNVLTRSITNQYLWERQGEMCNTLWMEALKIGLVGAPYGSADLAGLWRSGESTACLAMCLGYPKQRDRNP